MCVCVCVYRRKNQFTTPTKYFKTRLYILLLFIIRYHVPASPHALQGHVVFPIFYFSHCTIIVAATTKTPRLPSTRAGIYMCVHARSHYYNLYLPYNIISRVIFTIIYRATFCVLLRVTRIYYIYCNCNKTACSYILYAI